MFHFFTSEDFAQNPLSQVPKTYKVNVGSGVMIKTSDEYLHLYTGGLRTCVAFGLINPIGQSALLIHFFHIDQIKNDLMPIIARFIECSGESKEEISCVIAGGRSFYETSESMCEELISVAKQELLSKFNPMKLSLFAPITADDKETLSLQINLKTGNCEMAFCEESVLSEENMCQTNQIDFVDLITAAPQMTFTK